MWFSGAIFAYINFRGRRAANTAGGSAILVPLGGHIGKCQYHTIILDKAPCMYKKHEQLLAQDPVTGEIT